jgi:hypothetical protein
MFYVCSKQTLSVSENIKYQCRPYHMHKQGYILWGVWDSTFVCILSIRPLSTACCLPMLAHQLTDMYVNLLTSPAIPLVRVGTHMTWFPS